MLRLCGTVVCFPATLQVQSICTCFNSHTHFSHISYVCTYMADKELHIDKLCVREVYTEEESCSAEETLLTPARPGIRMPSQSLAQDISSRSVLIGVVTRDNFTTPRMQSPPLQDISNRNVGSGEFVIAQEDVVQCLAVCKSRRNLAARLANKLFTTEEKFGSNCRGACGKTALNYLKVQAIFVTCSKHYPMDRLETGTTAGEGDA